MTDITIFENINIRSKDFTPGERKVARTITANYPAAGLLTVAELAKKARVSGQTVIRFSAKLGFEGYAQFQKKIIHEIQLRTESPLNMYSGREVGSSLFEHCIQSYQQTIEESVQRLSPHELDAAIKLIADPQRKIICTGGRFSELLADYFYRHLMQIRANTTYLGANTDARNKHLVDVTKKTVLVVMDFRRYQKDTIEFAARAVEKGASVILITDFYLSPISHVAKHVISVSVKTPSPFDTIVSATAIVEAMLAVLVDEMSDKALNRIKEIEKYEGDDV